MTPIRSSPPNAPARRVATSYLARHVFIVFFGFLAVAGPLSVLPIFVTQTLGFGVTAVGWVIALQSIVTVLTRHFAGGIADRKGPKFAVIVGLPLAAAAGLFYAAAGTAQLPVVWLLLLLVPGRLVLGLAESLFMTGTMSWGIAALGPARAGVVMSWQGIAMYAAFGFGAPLGLAVFAKANFLGVAVMTAVAPMIALAMALPLPAVPGSGGERIPFYRVVALIWRQGLVLSLATVPFAAMAAFLVLDFAAKGWGNAGAALTAFGAGYIAVRLLASHLPDRYGGALTAGASLVIEGVGQLVLWLAPSEGVAFCGALLTGVGFSLVFPAMGVDATRRVPADLRGRAVGNFIAFFDIAIGVTGPLAGLLVSRAGYPPLFLAGAVSTMIAIGLLATGPRRSPVL